MIFDWGVPHIEKALDDGLNMGGSRIFDWGGPHIEKARDDRRNVALFTLKSWPIGGGHGPVAPPPGTALDGQ